jgi:hypothetical protein
MAKGLESTNRRDAKYKHDKGETNVYLKGREECGQGSAGQKGRAIE